jgi:hypothetical protein
LAVGLAGIAAYLLMAAVAWWSMGRQSGNVRDWADFLEFLQWRLTFGARGNLRQAAPFEASRWGYFGFAINLIGFVLGVATMCWVTEGKGYCSRCRRHLTMVGTQTRRSSDPEAAATAFHPIIAAMRAGRIQEALDLHADLDAADRKGVLTTAISVVACPGCGAHTATLAGDYPKDHNVAVAGGFLFEGMTDRRITIRG